MRDKLTEALKSNNVDYADIRIEDMTRSWVIYRGPEIDSIGSSRVVGGIVRALYKGGWGYATFNNLDNLDKRVKEACETAKLVGGGETHFAQVEPVIESITASMGKDFRSIQLADKKSLMEEYNQIILNYDEKIQTSSVRYADRFIKTWYANTHGTYIEEEKPDVNIMTVATAREGDVVQVASKKGGSVGDFSSVENFHDKAEEAAKMAVELLSAPVVKGGTYTVVADPKVTGLFTHEAFGHLSEADFVDENPQLRELMAIGKRFGVENLNIIDDGAFPGGLGTHKYDYEGTPTKENYLIKEGILVGRLHSRETAAKMGEEPTGNARAVEFQHPPIVRMTNTYIGPGPDKYEDMFKDIELGVHPVGFKGGQTAMEMFTFSTAYGYMIRNGKIAELVRDVVLTGNVFETLENIDMIGDQVEWWPNSPGGCGKGGQYPLRVGVGGPPIRIQNCVVGGAQ
jgi:TldD protein